MAKHQHPELKAAGARVQGGRVRGSWKVAAETWHANYLVENELRLTAEATKPDLAALRAKVAQMLVDAESEPVQLAVRAYERVLAHIDAEIARCQGGEK